MAENKKTLKSNFRRPALKTALRYIKKYKDLAAAGQLDSTKELKLLESYQAIADAYETTGLDPEKFTKKKKSAKISKRPSRGNYIGESVSKARRYLKRVARYPEEKKQQPNIAIHIKEAEEVLHRAELRNEGRKTKRAVRRKTKEIQKSVETKKFEEVTGPDGEVIRFRLEPYKSGPLAGKFRRRVRTQEEPQQGDVILDLTGPTDTGEGVKAWRIAKNRRRKHPASKEMIETYKDSVLYKTRLLAAGKITLQQLKDFIDQELQKPSTAEHQSKARQWAESTKPRRNF